MAGGVTDVSLTAQGHALTRALTQTQEVALSLAGAYATKTAARNKQAMSSLLVRLQHTGADWSGQVRAPLVRVERRRERRACECIAVARGCPRALVVEQGPRIQNPTPETRTQGWRFKRAAGALRP